MIGVLFNEYNSYYKTRELTIVYNDTKYGLKLSDTGCEISEIYNSCGDKRIILDVDESYTEFENVNRMNQDHMNLIKSLDKLLGINLEKFIK